MKQVEDKVTADIEDILVWADPGTWCYRYELQEMQHRSDDFSVLYFGTPEYNLFLEVNT
jgi:hypothetical protein